MKFQLTQDQAIHIAGISGFGMSAIARILLERGFTVSGSDERISPLSTALRQDGTTITIGHAVENINTADVIIASSAIPETNVELLAARKKGIPVLRRREAIGVITAGYRTLAVAGTHGKTTTTALLTHILIEAGLDPTYIVGGVLNNTGTNAAVGKSDLFVIEADEYREMFLGLKPQYSIITGIEYDHPDVFPSFEALVETFERFVDCLDDPGVLVGCIDNLASARLVIQRRADKKHAITYGIRQEKHADWSAAHIATSLRHGMQFTAVHGAKEIGTAHLNLAGRHNVENALAAIAVASDLGVPFEKTADALDSFKGTGRRSEIMGEIEGIIIISDYAHHPTAIQATLEAWKSNPRCKRLWAVWQPHTYNRLRALADEFMFAFNDADYVLITDVYSVRETVTPGLTAPDLTTKMTAQGHHSVQYSGSLENTAEMLSQEVQKGDCVVILSAGDAPAVGRLLLQHLEIQG